MKNTLLIIFLFTCSFSFGKDSLRYDLLTWKVKREIKKKTKEFCKDTLGLSSWQYGIDDVSQISIWEGELDRVEQYRYNQDSLAGIGIFSIWLKEIRNDDFQWVLKFDTYGDLVEILMYGRNLAFGPWTCYWHHILGKELFDPRYVHVTIPYQ
jgi:hypothetical protein